MPIDADLQDPPELIPLMIEWGRGGSERCSPRSPSHREAHPRTSPHSRKPSARGLENDSDLAPQSSEVNINAIGANSIQIEIFAALATRSGYLSRGTIHKLFLDILRLAKEHDLGLGRGMDKDPVYYLQEG